MKTRLFRNPLLYWLIALLLFQGLQPPMLAQTGPTHIAVVVIEGEGVTNPARRRVAKEPIVRVEDDDHRPVAGAAVVFALPVSGTSGEFANGGKTLAVLTGNEGTAEARGLRTNDIPGKLQIYVNASYHGLRARGLITQFVETPAGERPGIAALRSGRSSGGKWKWVALGLAVAGGGAGAGLYFARRTGSAPVSVSTGSVVFGSPR